MERVQGVLCGFEYRVRQDRADDGDQLCDLGRHEADIGYIGGPWIQTYVQVNAESLTFWCYLSVAKDEERIG